MNNVYWPSLGHIDTKLSMKMATFLNSVHHQGKSAKVGDEDRNVRSARPCVRHRKEITTANAQKRVAGSGDLHSTCINSERHAARFDITYPLLDTNQRDNNDTGNIGVY